MNLTSLITFPVRLGIGVARTTIDVAAGAGRKVGLLDGDDQADDERAPAPAPAPRPTATSPSRPKAPTRAPASRPKPAAKPAATAPKAAAAARKADPAASKAAPTPPPETAAPERRTAPGAVESEEVTLIARVEAVVLGDADSPAFSVHVNPIGGVVRLSGRASGTDQVRELQRRALSVPGVKRVENLLVLPDTPAPSGQNGHSVS